MVLEYKNVLPDLLADDHKIIINANRTPADEHVRRYNVPTVNEEAVFIVGNQSNRRDVIIQRRGGGKHHISEMHRFYNAFQYPLIYWAGQEGYDITLKLMNKSNSKPVPVFAFQLI